MNAPRSVPEAVIERQILASDPARSAWVSANAGSGKTHVLAQRVIRLLLAGVDPARILCITFTKAAAANMANKVFQDLRAWTVLDDAALDEAMRQAGVGRIDDQRRRRADDGCPDVGEAITVVVRPPGLFERRQHAVGDEVHRHAAGDDERNGDDLALHAPQVAKQLPV